MCSTAGPRQQRRRESSGTKYLRKGVGGALERGWSRRKGCLSCDAEGCVTEASGQFLLTDLKFLGVMKLQEGPGYSAQDIEVKVFFLLPRHKGCLLGSAEAHQPPVAASHKAPLSHRCHSPAQNSSSNGHGQAQTPKTGHNKHVPETCLLTFNLLCDQSTLTLSTFFTLYLVYVVFEHPISFAAQCCDINALVVTCLRKGRLRKVAAMRSMDTTNREIKNSNTNKGAEILCHAISNLSHQGWYLHNTYTIADLGTCHQVPCFLAY